MSTRFKEVKNPEIKDVETVLPIGQTVGSAGADVYSKETVVLAPKQQYIFTSDVKVKLEKDEVCYILARSSLCLKGLSPVITIGVIDSDYYGNENNDGNIKFGYINSTEHYLKIEKGERIAQCVIHKIIPPETLDKERKGGFGSTDGL